MSKKRTFSDGLRRVIKTCGKSRYQIWKETGIHQATLSRFVLGKRGLSMDVLDTLADCLGLTVTVKSKRKSR